MINIPTGEDRLKLIFNSGATDENLAAISQYIYENAISGDRAAVKVVKEQGAVYLVGQELTKPLTYTKTLGRVATILAAQGHSMKEIVSHEDSPSLALTVEGSEVISIIKNLHKEFVGPTTTT